VLVLREEEMRTLEAPKEEEPHHLHLLGNNPVRGRDHGRKGCSEGKSAVIGVD